MKPNIVIVDYGLGNIFSIQKAFGYLGMPTECTADAKKIMSADALILPGVGAFEDGMQGLRKRGLTSVIADFSKSGRPLLGICLGMQLLMTTSEEFGHHEGLNLILGRVKRISSGNEISQAKVPHVGWNKVNAYHNFPNPWAHTILKGLPDGFLTYFLHSYAVIPDNALHTLAQTEYGGHTFCSAVYKDNIYGVQFHPEKSAEAGLEVLRNFMSVTRGANHEFIGKY